MTPPRKHGGHARLKHGKRRKCLSPSTGACRRWTYRKKRAQSDHRIWRRFGIIAGKLLHRSNATTNYQTVINPPDT